MNFAFKFSKIGVFSPKFGTLNKQFSDKNFFPTTFDN